MRRHTPRGKPTVRRKLTWADAEFEFTYSTAAGVEALDLLAAYRTAGGLMQGLTVTRTLLSVRSACDGPVGGLDAVRIGLLVTGTKAELGASPTAYSPLQDPYEDWMWNAAYSTVAAPNSVINLTAGTSPVTATSVFWDVKSKRRLDELGETLWLNVDKIGTTIATTEFSISARVLLMLP